MFEPLVKSEGEKVMVSPVIELITASLRDPVPPFAVEVTMV